MKNSKEYTQKTGKLYRLLKKKHGKVKRARYDEPIEGLVHAILSERMRETDAKRAIRKIKQHFVDFNDLRVSRTEEILDVLGGEDAEYKQTASSVTKILNALFNKYDTLDLSGLLEIGKRQARKELEEIEDMSKYVLDYVFLAVLHGHAIPLNEQMVDYLRTAECVHPESVVDEIGGFLVRQISASDGYEFYRLLKKESELSSKSGIAKKLTETSTQTKKKTTKKKKTKTAKKKTTRKKRS